MKIDYLLRSLIFVPGNREDLLLKAVESDADALILDIEDSVQPKDNKNNARKTINRLIDQGTFEGRILFVRINDLESGDLLDDLNSLSRPEIKGFVYPKSTSAEDIFFIDKLLKAYETKNNIQVGYFHLIPLIETTEAVINALQIAKSSNRIIALAYGCEDFLADLQGSHDLGELALNTPRALIAMAARAANVLPIDTVHVKVHDLNDLEFNLKIAKALGFEGMLVLNPKEIPIVHHYLSPSMNEVERAKEIVTQFEYSVSNGVGVSVVNGKFIGPPLLEAAKKVIFKARRIQSRSATRFRDS